MAKLVFALLAASLPGALGFGRVATSRVSSVRSAVAVAPSHVAMASTTAPHGGKLSNLMASAGAALAAKAGCTKTVELTDRQSCDVELLSVGGLSPLQGFMSQADYESVHKTNRMTDGLLFGLPIVMDTNDEKMQPGDKLLMTYKGKNMAVMTVTEKWFPDKVRECVNCYGTASLEHPGVRMVAMERGKYYIAGPIVGLAQPVRDFPCLTPEQVRAALPEGKDVVAFQCRNPIHRAHYELFMRALTAENVDPTGVVLVHPTCGPTQEGDIDGVTRYKTYEVLKVETANPQIEWAYLPYSMHMAGPREAMQHMIIRKNYGCTHFIIGRDMAGSKSSITEEDFYGPYDAQDFANANSEELGVKTVPSLNLVYTAEKGYITADEAKTESLKPLKLSGTEFRRMLRAGEDIPEWFAFKSVVEVLRNCENA
ncbi:sulfate adenylyltransferase [Pavlovales sp. CCMP2436]|nr:sulfate adenylyltransferase [Pavlovales sp. CCMP2436]